MVSGFRFVLISAFVALVSISAIAEQRNEFDGQDTGAIEYKIFKRVYPRAERDTFWLDVHCERRAVVVLATCELRKDGRGVGRFPLRHEEPQGDIVRFRVACLSSDFVDGSLIHVSIRDRETGEGIGSARVRLRDAKVVEPARRKP